MFAIGNHCLQEREARGGGRGGEWPWEEPVLALGQLTL